MKSLWDVHPAVAFRFSKNLDPAWEWGVRGEESPVWLVDRTDRTGVGCYPTHR